MPTTPYPTSTICAIATAPGVGGIAIIRLSGAKALAIASQHLQSQDKPIDLVNRPARRAVYADFVDGSELIDEVIVLPFVAPHSFTGEDVVEISCHGSRFITRRILEVLIASGAEMARPGEFSQRAYLNGRLDLAEAEAVADIIVSETQAQHRMAMQQMRGGFSARLMELRSELLKFTSLMELELDFPEEDVEFADRSELQQLAESISHQIARLVDSYRLGNAVRSGIPVALVGATNAGKSTLLNTLLGEERAIVSDIHGTTRDTVEDTFTLGGYLFRFVDTAGFRHTSDTIEALGIQRSRAKMQSSEIVLILVDASRIDEVEQRTTLDEILSTSVEGTRLVLINKSDLVTPETIHRIQEQFAQRGFASEHILTLSAQDDSSVDALRACLVRLISEGTAQQPDIMVSNARHHQLLSEASHALHTLIDGMNDGTPTDLLTLELRTAIRAIGEITGEAITSDEALHYIFAHFCIGK